MGAPRVVCVPLEKPVPYQVANRQPRFHALASDELLVTEIHQSESFTELSAWWISVTEASALLSTHCRIFQRVVTCSVIITLQFTAKWLYLFVVKYSVGKPIHQSIGNFTVRLLLYRFVD